MANVKIVQQKSFIVGDLKTLDTVCNEFRLSNYKYIWKGTTIQVLEGEHLLKYIATIFWEEYKDVK